jgi:uncharacterized protein
MDDRSLCSAGNPIRPPEFEFNFLLAKGGSHFSGPLQFFFLLRGGKHVFYPRNLSRNNDGKKEERAKTSTFLPCGAFSLTGPGGQSCMAQKSSPRQKWADKFYRLLLRLERYFLFHLVQLFRIRDARERVARGFALGMMVNFFPTFGFGVWVSGFFARLLGGNAVAGFIGGATLTFFWPFLFYLNMLTGGWAQGRFIIRDPSEVTEAQIQSLVWGTTFTLGAVINGLVASTLLYFLVLGLLKHYRGKALRILVKWTKKHQARAMQRLKQKLPVLQA